MEWDRVPHAGRKSKDLTHRVLSQGLNQSSVSALEAAADTSLACGSPALITAFWTHFLFGSWQGPLRGATNNEQLTTEPPSMGALTPEQAQAGPPQRAEGPQSLSPATHRHRHMTTTIATGFPSLSLHSSSVRELTIAQAAS